MQIILKDPGFVVVRLLDRVGAVVSCGVVVSRDGSQFEVDTGIVAVGLLSN